MVITGKIDMNESTGKFLMVNEEAPITGGVNAVDGSH